MILSQDMPKNVFGLKIPKHGNSAPYPPNWKITNAFQMIPRPPSVDDLKPRYAQKRVLGPKCPNIVIRPNSPNWIFFLIIYIGWKRLANTLQMSPRSLSEEDFKPRYAQKCVLGPNMVIRPHTPQIGKFPSW